MVSSIREIAMFMLYLVLAYLLLANSTDFGNIISTIGSQWRATLYTLQAR